MEIEQTADYLRLIVRGVHIDPDIEDEEEARLAGVGLVRQIASLAAVQGLRSAGEATCNTSGWTPFVALSGDSIRQRTSDTSRVTVNSAAVLTGLANRTQWSEASLLLGGFFEAGTGSYRTSGDGRGDLDYYGAGLLSRLNLESGLYVEASVQGGRLTSDYRSSADTLSDAYDRPVAFDSTSTYVGAHVGMGYEQRLNEKLHMDITARYLWSRLEGDSLTVAGDPQQFDAITSHALQGGGRLSYVMTEHLTSYVGVTYEYEFDAKAEGNVYGYALPSHDLGGSTGIGEIGFVYKPQKSCGFSAEVRLQGYTGMREGVSGTLHARYEF